MEPSSPRQAAPIAASVVVVCDYAVEGSEAWDDFEKTLAALAKQDFSEAWELLVIESPDHVDRARQLLSKAFPEARVVTSKNGHTGAMRNLATKHARGAIIAMLDADCEPVPGWLRFGVETLRQHNDVDIVGGTTLYPPVNDMVRCLALIERGYLDPGGEGPRAVTRVAHNNAVYRREVLEQFPFPELPWVFSADCQQEPALRGGCQFLFDRRMVVTHAFDGWTIERDLRRNRGFNFIAARRHDRTLPYAFLGAIGPLAVPLIWGGQLLRDWATCFRVRQHYGVAMSKLPLAVGLSMLVRFLEVPGMMIALSGRELERTSYR